MKSWLVFLMCISWATPSLTNPTGRVAETSHFAGELKARGPQEQSLILPLKTTKVSLEVTSNLVHAQVRQVFFNDTQLNLEAVYTFPLPPGATVTEMVLKYDDRVLRSVVRERAAAKIIYDTAKREGRKTALLEQDRPNLFTTSVAHFQPGEEVEVVFSYLEPLPFNGSVYELHFPTTFGPRYLPEPFHPEPRGGEVLAESASLAPGGEGAHQPVVRQGFTDHFLEFEATLRGLPIRAIDSTSHDILVDEIDTNVYRVSLSAAADLPDRDLALRMELWEHETPQIEFLQSEGPRGVHGMLTIFPPLDEAFHVEAVPREVVFLIDTSGSMSGDPLAQAKRGLVRCLAMLRPEDRFQIVRFSHDFSAFRADFQAVDAAGLASAEAYIGVLEAGGGTEMQKALGHVLSFPQTPGYMRVVVFLTDGDVGNEESLVRLVQSRLNRARIFSFGVGSAPNAYLLKKVSELGLGASHFIRNEEDIGAVMADFFETVNAPVLTDVEVVWRDREGQLFDKVEVYPAVAPDVFLKRPVQLCYRYDDFFEGSIEVRGWLNGEPVVYVHETVAGQRRLLPGMERIFGKARVDDLMVDWINAPPSDKDNLRQEIVATALDYQLLTRFTSRVAVEERPAAYASGNLHAVTVPVMAKNGVEPVFPATATADPLWLLAALCSLIMGGCLLGAARFTTLSNGRDPY